MDLDPSTLTQADEAFVRTMAQYAEQKPGSGISDTDVLERLRAEGFSDMTVEAVNQIARPFADAHYCSISPSPPAQPGSCYVQPKRRMVHLAKRLENRAARTRARIERHPILGKLVGIHPVIGTIGGIVGLVGGIAGLIALGLRGC